MFGLGKKTKRTTSEQEKKTMELGRFPRPDMDKLTQSFTTIYKEFNKNGLYKDDAVMYDDMQQTIHTLNQVYTRLYNRKESNLGQKDIQVFVDHLMQKMKRLKDIVTKS